MSQHLGRLREAHYDRANYREGYFGIEDAREGYLGEGIEEKKRGLDVQFLVVGNHLEELEVKHVKACCVVLRDLHLLEQGLAEDGHRDTVHLLEHEHEVLQHEVPNLELPVKLDQNEGKSLVEQRCNGVLDLCKRFK